VRDVDEAMIPVQTIEVSSAALTLARAFADDPIFALLFGGSVPEHRARRFFEIVGTMQLHHGLVFRTPAMEAAAIWAPPGEWKVSATQIARNSIGLMRVFGRRLFANLAILGRLEENHPQEPHYYLEFIGTAPAHQGKGMGTRLLQPMIERCDTEGVGAYLESSKESNLAFYGRFGFEITKVITHKAAKGQAQLQQWLMWRDPK
jgi:ribosomal protein S18 acetylase RimI-like enzyme